MRARAFLLLMPLLTLSSLAVAQTTLPKGTTKDAPVSKGKTDVTAEGFQAAARKEGEEKDATELQLQAGGLAATGNARQLSLTAATSFRLRRSDDQLTLIGAGNYSRASVGGRAIETTVENLQAKSRYDRFFASDWTAFLGLQARRDRFAGLGLRLQVDPGVGYYFVNRAERIFWAELGYDLLHDVRRDDARIPRDADGNPVAGAALLSKTNTVHSGRAFLGYRYTINEGVAIATGIEYLQGLSDTSVHRVNGEAVVTSKFTDTLSLATSFLFRYDNKALPGKEQLDTLTSVSLVYSVL